MRYRIFDLKGHNCIVGYNETTIRYQLEDIKEYYDSFNSIREAEEYVYINGEKLKGCNLIILPVYSIDCLGGVK